MILPALQQTNSNWTFIVLNLSIQEDSKAQKPVELTMHSPSSEVFQKVHH